MSARTLSRVALAMAVVAVVGLGVLLVGQARDPDAASAPLPERVDYVALGDSYSSGPFIPATRRDAPGCFRSTNNYPAYLADLLEVDSYRDATCSGATTDDLLRPQAVLLGSGRPPAQVANLSSDTDLVTVGIGGNDFGLFGSLAGGCGQGVSGRRDAAPCRDSFVDAEGRDMKAVDARRVEGTVRAALGEVAARAPRAEVYVVGYPRLLPPTGTCRAAGFTRADADWAREIARLLNRSLRLAAEGSAATYVDLYRASRGHDICAGDDAWVNGRSVRFDRALSYHPFQEGMAGVARVVFEAVTGEAAPEVAGDAAPPAGAVVGGR